MFQANLLYGIDEEEKKKDEKVKGRVAETEGPVSCPQPRSQTGVGCGPARCLGHTEQGR